MSNEVTTSSDAAALSPLPVSTPCNVCKAPGILACDLCTKTYYCTEAHKEEAGCRKCFWVAYGRKMWALKSDRLESSSYTAAFQEEYTAKLKEFKLVDSASPSSLSFSAMTRWLTSVQHTGNPPEPEPPTAALTYANCGLCQAAQVGHCLHWDLQQLADKHPDVWFPGTPFTGQLKMA